MTALTRANVRTWSMLGSAGTFGLAAMGLPDINPETLKMFCNSHPTRAIPLTEHESASLLRSVVSMPSAVLLLRWSGAPAPTARLFQLRDVFSLPWSN